MAFVNHFTADPWVEFDKEIEFFMLRGQQDFFIPKEGPVLEQGPQRQTSFDPRNRPTLSFCGGPGPEQSRLRDGTIGPVWEDPEKVGQGLEARCVGLMS